MHFLHKKFLKILKSTLDHVTILELHTWRLSSAGRAPALQAGGHRFEPCSLHHRFADIAQLVEQLICNQ